MVPDPAQAWARPVADCRGSQPLLKSFPHLSPSALARGLSVTCPCWWHPARRRELQPRHRASSGTEGECVGAAEPRAGAGGKGNARKGLFRAALCPFGALEVLRSGHSPAQGCAEGAALVPIALRTAEQIGFISRGKKPSCLHSGLQNSKCCLLLPIQTRLHPKAAPKWLLEAGASAPCTSLWRYLSPWCRELPAWLGSR